MAIETAEVELSKSDILMNPECRDGKHSNCDGMGFDLQTDNYVPCPCSCHKSSRWISTIRGKDGREWPI